MVVLWGSRGDGRPWGPRQLLEGLGGGSCDANSVSLLFFDSKDPADVNRLETSHMCTGGEMAAHRSVGRLQHCGSELRHWVADAAVSGALADPAWAASARGQADAIAHEILVLERESTPLEGAATEVFVDLSEVYALLRGTDGAGKKNEDDAQEFVRATTKFWVRQEDVSAVKLSILRHLPLFRYNPSDYTGDSQLINSAYLDNAERDLHHGRQKNMHPKADAIRLRWYGPREPSVVYVERKSEAQQPGEEASGRKDRFALPEQSVVPFLTGALTVEEASRALTNKGKSPGEVAPFAQLFADVQRAVIGQRLAPVVRTQYMRAAFQIPYDAAVRISMDTHVCMFLESPRGQPSCLEQGRWHRDPQEKPVPGDSICSEYAILEIKLMGT